MQLPKRGSVVLVGGNATFHGVRLHSETFTGECTPKGPRFYSRKPVRDKRLWHIPLIRGVCIPMYNLWLMMSNRIGWLLLAVATFFSVMTNFIVKDTIKLLSSEKFVPNTVDHLIAIIVVLLLVIVCMPKLLELFRWHGAEHMVMNWNIQFEAGGLTEPEDCSRFSKHCGSVFAVYTALLYVLSLFLFDLAPVCLLLSMGLGYEVFYFITHSDNVLSKALFTVPLCIQFLICQEPTQDQLSSVLCLIPIFENAQLGKD